MDGPTSSLPSGRNVLVIEDEVRLRTMLSRALNEMGFEATLTASAEAGLKAIAQRAFDIIVLDLNLPGMDGIELLERVRKQRCDAQVIILTGFGDLEAARRAIHLDVVEFLTKPCALGTLEAALERARQRRRGQIVGESSINGAPLLQFEAAAPPKAPPPEPAAEGDSLSLEELEQRHILSVLEKNSGNRAATAAELGISLRKLYYRLGEYERRGLLRREFSAD